MAKNKKQKRAKKLKARNKQRVIHNNVRNQFRIDKDKLTKFFPNDAERMDYIKALALDLDKQIEQCPV